MVDYRTVLDGGSDDDDNVDDDDDDDDDDHNIHCVSKKGPRHHRL